MKVRYRRLTTENLECRQLLAVAPLEFDGVGYFASPNDAVINRYDIANEQWLEPLNLSGATSPATAAEIDADGIYVAFDQAVYRYDLAGGAQTHLLNTATPIHGLHADGNVLFVNHSARHYTKVISINKTSNTVVDTMDDYLHVLRGSSIATDRNRLYGRSQNSSPSDLTFVTYDDLGNLLENGHTRYHGDFQGASMTWVFPDQRYVIDDSGNLYSTDTLLHSGRLGTGISDIGFVGANSPIVLSGNTLTSYSNGFLPLGSYELDSPADEIFVNDSNILVFRESAVAADGYSVEKVSLSDVSAGNASDTIDPVDLPYEVTASAIANDGTAMLYSAEHQSVFRWDPATSSYTQSIRLRGVPLYVAYSSEFNVLYTAYESGLIRKIDFNSASVEEVPFADLPATPLGLVAAGRYLVAEDGSGARSTLNTISESGIIIDSREWHYSSSELVWNESSQEIMYLSMSSPSDLHARKINVNGTDSSLVVGGIGDDRDSPLHGSGLIRLPLRVSPDGGSVVLGSGGVFRTGDLAPSHHSLANRVDDLAWINDQLFSVRNIAGLAQMQGWKGSDYALDGVRQFPGEAKRLLAVQDDALLLIVSDATGVPVFHLLDSDLQDIDVGGSSLEEPVVSWADPDPLLGYQRLGETQLNATADVPGSLAYFPAVGVLLEPGEHELSATFTPSDVSRYRSVTKTVNIEVFGVDFGDAAAAETTGFLSSYPVNLEDDGARHIIDGPLFLGDGVDAETDGISTNQPSGGDNANGQDEDGVRFLASIFSLSEAFHSSFSVDVTGDGVVNAWIDFNADGDWDDAGEHVAQDVDVSNGAHLIPFEVPANLSVGTTLARVRLSSAGNLAPTGLARDGEVEDHLLEVIRVGEEIEVLPMTLDAITVDYASAQIVYRQADRVLATYPRWMFSLYCYHGDDQDETIALSSLASGEMYLVGDARGGFDQIVVTAAYQDLNFVRHPENGIREVELVDLSGYGPNKLTLDETSAVRLRGNTTPLQVRHDAADQVFFEGSWAVQPRSSSYDGQYHVVVSGDAEVHVFNDRPRRNPIEPTDVNLDGTSSPMDALLVINYLNSLREEGAATDRYYDVSGDDHISPLDALLVVNHLNQQ